jgi:hypothetical protein
MYVSKKVICEWCRWNCKNLRSWTNFTASRSWRKSFFMIVCQYRGRSHLTCLSHAECVMCMQRNGYSFTVFLGEPDFDWFDWLKTATDFESLVPRLVFPFRDHLKIHWSEKRRNYVVSTLAPPRRAASENQKTIFRSEKSTCKAKVNIKHMKSTMFIGMLLNWRFVRTWFELQ